MIEPLPTPASLKAQAKRLKTQLEASGETISHSHSLELLAIHHGYRDWNTLNAIITRKAPAPVAVGDKVDGRYLSHAISATIVSVQPLQLGRYRIQLKLDEAVDVAASRRFSAWRKQIIAVIDGTGVTAETTSDGKPHLQLDLSP